MIQWNHKTSPKAYAAWILPCLLFIALACNGESGGEAVHRDIRPDVGIDTSPDGAMDGYLNVDAAVDSGQASTGSDAGSFMPTLDPVSYTHLTLPTTPYV